MIWNLEQKLILLKILALILPLKNHDEDEQFDREMEHNFVSWYFYIKSFLEL
jgi:hypothetical protein